MIIFLWIVGVIALVIIGYFIFYCVTMTRISGALIEAMVRRDVKEMEKISKSKHLPPYTKAAINYHVNNYKEVTKEKNGN